MGAEKEKVQTVVTGTFPAQRFFDTLAAILSHREGVEAGGVYVNHKYSCMERCRAAGFSLCRRYHKGHRSVLGQYLQGMREGLYVLHMYQQVSGMRESGS